MLYQNQPYFFNQMKVKKIMCQFFYPAQYRVLAGSVIHMSVGLCVCVCVTIFLHILLLILNYHSPPLYAGIYILLKPLKSKHWRRNQVGPV